MASKSLDHVRTTQKVVGSDKSFDDWQFIEENKQPSSGSEDSEAEVADEAEGVDFGHRSAKLSGSPNHIGELLKPRTPSKKMQLE